jgi:hypothetical protein
MKSNLGMEHSKFGFIFFRVLVVSGLMGFQSFYSFAESLHAPNDQVDKLVDAYNASKVLILSNSTHETNATYIYLKDLLERVGNDPHLKLIGLERLNESDDLLMEGSINPISKILPPVPISNPSVRAQVCEEKNGIHRGFGEWAYTFSNFLPFVYNLNRNRSDPLLVRSFDGMTYDEINNDINTWPSMSA